MSSEPFGPVVVRRRLGVELRRLREEANLRLEQVAEELEVSPSKISRIETAHTIPKTWDVRNLLTVYGVSEDSGLRSQFLRWAEEGKAVAWWHPFSDASPTDLDYYMSLEAEAASVSQYCTPFIPGLLQTPRYAQEHLNALLDTLDSEAVDGLVKVRLGRQAALTREHDSLAYRAIVDEPAFLRLVGDRELMDEQYRHVVKIASSNLVDLRVRQLAAPPRRFAMSSFTIFAPRLSSIDTSIVNIEAAGRDYYIETQEETEEYRAAFQTLWNDSLSREQSIELVRALIS